MVRISILCAATCILHTSLAQRAHHSTTYKPGDISTAFQFGHNAWIENLAVRPNGNILFTTLDLATEVWEVEPGNNASGRAVIIFDNVTSATGFTQLEGDSYAVAIGKVDAAAGPQASAGTWAVHVIDFRDGRQIVRLAVALDDALLPNGLTTLDAENGIVLVADSYLGVVYRVDTNRSTYEIALDDAALKRSPSSALNLGVNGITKLRDWLYFSNTDQGVFGRVRIHGNGTAAGPFETIVRAPGVVTDDFALLPSGEAFQVAPNAVIQISRDGTYAPFVGGGNSTVVAGATSARFGHDDRRDVLYVVTNGAEYAPVGGTFSEPGKIVAVQVIRE